MPSRRSFLHLMAALAVAFAMVAAAGASPLITELMSSNNTTLADQDQDFADWVEIYNPDAAAINLTGWHLTNKSGNLTKWTFPNVILNSGAYLIVFCSGKNYVDPLRPLATNFSLSDSGGFVGLVSSDNTTVVSSYTFPALSPDISYGVTQPPSGMQTPRIGPLANPTPGAATGTCRTCS